MSKKVAILTSGGDAPGMNACIRAIVLVCERSGFNVVGYLHGYNGLLKQQYRELDARQMKLLDLVYEKIVFYYEHLYGTRPSLKYPLSLSRLMRLSNRGGQSVTLALKYLANTVPAGSNEKPKVFYDRIAAQRNKSHRPYRIFLRRRKSL